MNLYQYIVVDAALNGTGIRTEFTNSDIEVDKLNISEPLKSRVVDWLNRYQQQQFQGFEDAETAKSLDVEGISIARELRTELEGVKVSYYSEALGSRLVL